MKLIRTHTEVTFQIVKYSDTWHYSYRATPPYPDVREEPVIVARDLTYDQAVELRQELDDVGRVMES